jgi:hypothetical protein
MTAMRDTSWIKRSYPDLAYAPLSSAQVLDLYLPNDTPGPYPCIVAIHGGGFIFGDKRDDQVNAPVEAVRRGYAVAAMNYRMADEALFPALSRTSRRPSGSCVPRPKGSISIRRALPPGAIRRVVILPSWLASPALFRRSMTRRSATPRNKAMCRR